MLDNFLSIELLNPFVKESTIIIKKVPSAIPIMVEYTEKEIRPKLFL